MEQPFNAPTFIADVVAIAINSAIQDIFNAVGEYFRFTGGTTLTFGGAGNSRDTKHLTIQQSTHVIEVLNGIKRLHPLNRRAELDHYSSTYNPGAVDGTPEAFWLERTHDTDPGATLHITPPAPADTPVTLNIVTTFEIPHISSADISNDEIELPIPNDWVEIYLLPLARGHAMRSHYWIQKESAALYSADYDKAIAALALLNPKPREDKDTAPDPNQGKS